MSATTRGVSLPGSRWVRVLARLPRARSEVSSNLAAILQPAVVKHSLEIQPHFFVKEVVLKPLTLPDVSDDLLKTIPSEAIQCFITISVDDQLIDIAIPKMVIEGTLFRELDEPMPRTGPPGPELPHPKLPLGVREPRLPAELLRSLFDLLLPPPPGELFNVALPHRLYKFQSEGVLWLLRHSPGALLADDMGLGKTVQAIVAMRLLFRRGAITNALVVAPKSVLTSWARHFSDWAPGLRVRVTDGGPNARWGIWRALDARRCDVGIVTYESLVRDEYDIPSGLSFGLIVADETQRIKNPETKTHRMLASMRSERRWGLTGTPLENRVEELCTILFFLSRDPRLRPLVIPRATTRRHRQLVGMHGRVVRKATEQTMLRRRKTQVLDDLPKLTSRAAYISLGSGQRRAYELAERQGIARLQQGDIYITHVLSLITRLKQICNGAGGENAKLDWLQDYAENAAAQGDKTLVFSQYVETLERITPALSRFAPLTYVGNMSSRRRDQAIAAFQENPRHYLMLMSLRAGGTGLTLTAANHVVHFDAWWNPAVMNQATARTHRIGQPKGVFETTLVIENTIEERIQHILERKRILFKEFVDDLSTQGLSATLTEEELYSLFGLSPPRQRAGRAARLGVARNLEHGRLNALR